MDTLVRTTPKRDPVVIALVISIAWGSIAMLMYSNSEIAQHAGFFVCFPGWVAAYIVTGGVHNGHMDLLPILCALFTALISFGAIMLGMRLFGRGAR